MSSFFENPESSESEKPLIPPDYSDLKKSAESIGPSEDDDDDDSIDLDLELDEDEDEGKIETILDEQAKANEGKMLMSPFGNSQSSENSQPSQPSWGTGGKSSSNFWSGGGNPQPNSSTSWGSKPSYGGYGGGTFGQGSSYSGAATQQKRELDRTKKVLFIDFLDGVVETYQSNGSPGLLPRDIYDVKPRFDVWTKLSAFNPERVYMIIPKNLLNNSTVLQYGLMSMLGYYCCALAAFLRLPYDCCQILSQGMIGQPKEDIIGSLVGNGSNKIPKDVAILIGNNSGLYGQSNADFVAADRCGIAYYDLSQLLNDMY